MTDGALTERLARLEAMIDAHEKLRTVDAIAIDLRFKAAERAVETAMGAADRSSNKADIATEKRFDGVNEFRKSLDDAARLNIPRTEAEGLIKAANEKTDAMLKATNDKIEQLGKAAHDKTEQVSKVLTEKVDRVGAEIIALNALVASSQSKRQGETEGKKEGYGWIAAMIMGAIALTGFLMNMRR